MALSLSVKHAITILHEPLFVTVLHKKTPQKFCV